MVGKKGSLELIPLVVDHALWNGTSIWIRCLLIAPNLRNYIRRRGWILLISTRAFVKITQWLTATLTSKLISWATRFLIVGIYALSCRWRWCPTLKYFYILNKLRWIEWLMYLMVRLLARGFFIADHLQGLLLLVLACYIRSSLLLRDLLLNLADCSKLFLIGLVSHRAIVLWRLYLPRITWARCESLSPSWCCSETLLLLWRHLNNIFKSNLQI